MLIITLRFAQLYPQAVIPPDIQTYKAFLEYIARGKVGRLSKDGKPTVETIESFRREFETAWARNRKYYFPSIITTTVREVGLR